MASSRNANSQLTRCWPGGTESSAPLNHGTPIGYGLNSAPVHPAGAVEFLEPNETVSGRFCYTQSVRT